MTAEQTAVAAPMREARAHRKARAAAQLAGLIVFAGCTGNAAEGGTVGREGNVRFRTVTDLAFTSTLAVGSTFSVTGEKNDDEVDLGGAVLASSDEDVFVVEDATATRGTIRVTGSGSAELRVSKGDELVDAVAVNARKAVATALVDSALLTATDQVDARLPAGFALLSGEQVGLTVAAVDACGGDLLDLGASSLEASGASAAIDVGTTAGFVVQPAEAGALSLTLKSPGLDALEYDVSVITSSDVDEAKLAVAAAEENQAVVWGRAFADDVELVGNLAFSWTSSERIALSGASGLSVTANVDMPAQGELPDDRPATVTVEIFGEEGTVDFLALTDQDIVQARGTPARVPPEPKAQGCGGDATCAGLLAALSLRRLAKLAR